MSSSFLFSSRPLISIVSLGPSLPCLALPCLALSCLALHYLVYELRINEYTNIRSMTTHVTRHTSHTCLSSGRYWDSGQRTPEGRHVGASEKRMVVCGTIVRWYVFIRMMLVCCE